MFSPCGIPVERLLEGRPLLAPTGTGWECGHTYNAAAVHLKPNETALIRDLLGSAPLTEEIRREGLVAVHYRAQPRVSPGFRGPRSSIGLALFTPKLKLIRRFAEPVIRPAEDPYACDRDGVEDPRVTRIGDQFYLVYCGYTVLPDGRGNVQVCLARSSDLIHWEKLGPARGDVNRWPNKDGLLLPERIQGHYILLHRPMAGMPSQFSIELAYSESLTGVWRNCGKVLSAPPQPHCQASWVGAGSVPLPLGDGRYLVIFHTGNYLKGGCRYYTADAALFNFNRFSPDQPSEIVESILPRLFTPETEYERDAPGYGPNGLHCVFPCGSYMYGDYLHILYGGGDSYVLAARVRRDALLARLTLDSAMRRAA